jgi:hypothetical protein
VVTLCPVGVTSGDPGDHFAPFLQVLGPLRPRSLLIRRLV